MDLGVLVPILGIVFTFGMPVMIIGLVLYFKHKNQRLFQESLQELVKSGQELSPELLSSLPGYREAESRPRNDVRTGIITAGVGLGLVVFGLAQETDLIGPGLLVATVGVTFLGYGLYDKYKNSDLNDE